MARLAKVNELRPYKDLDLIDQYATRFALDPDWVFDNTRFDTLMEFCIKWKKEAEYRERFEDIWKEIHASPTK